MINRKKKIRFLLSAWIIVAILFSASVGLYIYLNRGDTFTVQDTLADGKGKKATVILLAGQSNASGCSSDAYLQKNVSAEQYAQYQNGYDNVYINYYASGTNQSNGFVKCSVKQGEQGACFGPELGLAEKLHQLYPDELFFIIKYAWGGTNLFSQWLSPSSKGETGELCRNFVRYTKTSIEYLISKNYDIQIEGMCWMQGESDAYPMENAANYEMHLTNFIRDVRKAFSRYAAEDGIAFIDAYIADNPMYWVYCDEVNRGKKAVADGDHMNVVVDTIFHGLTCDQEPEDNPDKAHYDSLSEIKLGHLFAEELAAFLD